MQDCRCLSARNPQEKIVAEISHGARRDRDIHPGEASAQHTAHCSRQPRAPRPPACLPARARTPPPPQRTVKKPPTRAHAARHFPFPFFLFGFACRWFFLIRRGTARSPGSRPRTSWRRRSGKGDPGWGCHCCSGAGGAGDARRGGRLRPPGVGLDGGARQRDLDWAWVGLDLAGCPSSLAVVGVGSWHCILQLPVGTVVSAS